MVKAAAANIMWMPVVYTKDEDSQQKESHSAEDEYRVGWVDVQRCEEYVHLCPAIPVCDPLQCVVFKKH